VARENGDPLYTSFALNALTGIHLGAGLSLAGARAACEEESRFTTEYGERTSVRMNQEVSEGLARLADATAAEMDAWCDTVAGDQAAAGTALADVLSIAGNITTTTVFRRFDAATRSMERLGTLARALAGLRGEPLYYFFGALTLYQTEGATRPERPEAWSARRRARFRSTAEKKLRAMAEMLPANYLHLHLMLRAQRLQAEGRGLAALPDYDRAIEHARKHGLVRDAALACELAGRHCAAEGQLRFAQVYLQDARYGYELWGSRAKVEQLEREFPEWLRAMPAPGATTVSISRPTTTSISTDSIGGGTDIDLATVVRASQAIAGEITLPGLLTKLMTFVLENAGAQTAALLQAKGDEIEAQALGRVTESGIEVRTTSLHAVDDRVCMAIVQYVARTQEIVILADASRDGMFRSHPYIVERQTRSVLCVPLMQQGKLSGILYLENSLIGGAFTPERVEVLRTLASSVAIAIENATLYGSLEARVVERTEQLSTANRSLQQLFDHMRQAIVAFGPDGRVTGDVSRQAQSFFGHRSLEGATAHDLLFGHMADYELESILFREWLESVFQVEVSDVEALCALAPSYVALRVGRPDEIHLALEFRPIVSEGNVSRIMLLATDETEKHRLERVVETREAEHARQMAAMRRIAAGGPQLFASFLATSEARLSRFESDLGSEGRSLLRGEVEQLFRHAHTLKSDARTFELHALESASASLETKLAELREQVAVITPSGRSMRPVSSDATTEMHRVLREGLAQARAALAQARASFVEASPIGAAVLEQVTVSRTELDRLRALIGQRDDEVGRVLARLSARPFGEVVVYLVEGVGAWAEALGKQARIEVSGREIGLSPELASCVSSALGHLVRNSIAHGIELPDARARAGKDPVGVIQLSCADVRGRPAIVVEDDGAGIDVAALAAKAAAVGIPVVAGEEADLVFASGLSTRAQVDDFAGRGVGLDAVRQELDALGMTIAVTTTAGRGSRFVIASRPRPEVRLVGGSSA
jgi:GAF domain-containing protein/HPt (histidine-containing phosphotransfer) domain-containing protein